MNWNLQTNDFRTALLKGEISNPTKHELISAGLKKLGLFWILALLCLPIPGLHFILVPGFFIYGIWTFLKIQKNFAFLKRGSYDCPGCKTTHEIQNIFINPQEKWRCNKCGLQTVLMKTND